MWDLAEFERKFAWGGCWEEAAFSVPSHLPVSDTFLELLVPWCIFFKKWKFKMWCLCSSALTLDLCVISLIKKVKERKSLSLVSLSLQDLTTDLLIKSARGGGLLKQTHFITHGSLCVLSFHLIFGLLWTPNLSLGDWDLEELSHLLLVTWFLCIRFWICSCKTFFFFSAL